MKEYKNPSLEIQKLTAEDVLNTSGDPIMPEIDFGEFGNDTPPESLR